MNIQILFLILAFIFAGTIILIFEIEKLTKKIYKLPFAESKQKHIKMGDARQYCTCGKENCIEKTDKELEKRDFLFEKIIMYPSNPYRADQYTKIIKELENEMNKCFMVPKKWFYKDGD